MGSFRAVAWNCRRATADSGVWDYLVDLGPDVALLQEVSSVPNKVAENWECRLIRAMGKSGKAQQFSTGVLVRGSIVSQITLSSTAPWVTRELDHFAGNLPAFTVDLRNNVRLQVVSVHSPAWPVTSSRLAGIDVSEVKLSKSPDVWVADLLWDAIRSLNNLSHESWLFAGDFNTCETFDSWKGGPRGNREYLDRMARLGLIECLRESRGCLTPTYRKPKGGAVKNQIDHMFVSPPLASRLSHCETGSRKHVFERGLSDHLPIVADFRA